MMKESVISVTSADPGIVTIILDRPEKRNALNTEVIQEFIHCLKKIATDRDTRVVMIAGNGAHFCAGADIAHMQQIAQASREENIVDAKQLALLLQMLYTFPKPTIALAHGATMGGGLGILACCDIAIAANNSNFCFSEVKIGLTPSVISPYIVSAIGERATRYYFLTAEKFTAKDAQRIGLVQHIVADDQLIHFGTALAKEIVKNSPHALAEAKNLISIIAGEKISKELVSFTAEHLAGVRATEDAQEGLRAFLEKREPIWK